MKLRTTIGAIAGTGLSAMLRVIGLGAMTVLACAAIAACSGSTPPDTSATSSLPAAAASPGDTVSLPANGTGTPSETPTSTETPTPTPTTPTPTPTTPTPTPTAAPATGGGGTAGIQDATLFIIGGAAIVAGAGGIAYRRRATRNR